MNAVNYFFLLKVGLIDLLNWCWSVLYVSIGMETRPDMKPPLLPFFTTPILQPMTARCELIKGQSPGGSARSYVNSREVGNFSLPTITLYILYPRKNRKMNGGGCRNFFWYSVFNLWKSNTGEHEPSSLKSTGTIKPGGNAEQI